MDSQIYQNFIKTDDPIIVKMSGEDIVKSRSDLEDGLDIGYRDCIEKYGQDFAEFTISVSNLLFHFENYFPVCHALFPSSKTQSNELGVKAQIELNPTLIDASSTDQLILDLDELVGYYNKDLKLAKHLLEAANKDRSTFSAVHLAKTFFSNFADYEKWVSPIEGFFHQKHKEEEQIYQNYFSFIFNQTKKLLDKTNFLDYEKAYLTTDIHEHWLVNRGLENNFHGTTSNDLLNKVVNAFEALNLVVDTPGCTINCIKEASKILSQPITVDKPEYFVNEFLEMYEEGRFVGYDKNAIDLVDLLDWVFSDGKWQGFTHGFQIYEPEKWGGGTKSFTFGKNQLITDIRKNLVELIAKTEDIRFVNRVGDHFSGTLKRLREIEGYKNYEEQFFRHFNGLLSNIVRDYDKNDTQPFDLERTVLKSLENYEELTKVNPPTDHLINKKLDRGLYREFGFKHNDFWKRLLDVYSGWIKSYDEFSKYEDHLNYKRGPLYFIQIPGKLKRYFPLFIYNLFQKNMSENFGQDIDEHRLNLSEEVKRLHPVLCDLDLSSFMALNRSLTMAAMDNKIGDLTATQQEFFHQYLDNESRLSVPFDITKRDEHGRHAGKFTGYYDITMYIPLPEEEAKEQCYKEVRAFVKIFKNVETRAREEQMHKRVEKGGTRAITKLLFSYKNIIVYEYADDEWVKSGLPNKGGDDRDYLIYQMINALTDCEKSYRK